MRKLILILCVLLCLSFALCACTETPEDNAGESTGPSAGTSTSTEESSLPPDDGKVTYTVYVVDENGKALTGGTIQFCLNSCIPCVLDANGVASMRLEEADYKVSFVKFPDGYALAGDETEFYFEEGSYEMTITLKAAG